MTGGGGDHLLDQSRLPADLLRTGDLRRFIAAVNATSTWTGRSPSSIALTAARMAVPLSARSLYRRVRPAPSGYRAILSRDLDHELQNVDPLSEPRDIGLGSLTNNSLAHYGRNAKTTLTLESIEAEHAGEGVDVVHPHFDRELYEFVASIPLRVFPFDGRSKVLARDGFADVLPSSVRERRTKTLVTGYSDYLFSQHAPMYRERYPVVRATTLEYVDADYFAELLQRLDGGRTLDVVSRRGLWFAWTLMAFQDLLPRYESAH
jgi:hypothetical protein